MPSKIESGVTIKIPPKHEHLATALRELVNDYDFDRLIELCKTKEKQEIL